MKTAQEMIDTLQAEVHRQMSQVLMLYDEIGVNEEQRAELFQTTCNVMISNLTRLTTEAKELRDVLVQQIQTFAQEINDIAMQLNETVDESELKTAAALNGLHARMDALAEMRRKLNDKRMLRSKVIVSNIQCLERFYKELGVPEAEMIHDPNPNDFSAQRVDLLSKEVDRMLNAKRERLVLVKSMVDQVLGMCEELAMQPDDFTLAYNTIRVDDVHDAGNAVALDESVLQELQNRETLLMQERGSRRANMQSMMEQIHALWTRLGTDAEHRQAFLAEVQDRLTTDAVNRVQQELHAMQVEKASKMEQLVDAVRNEIAELYKQLKYVQEQYHPSLFQATVFDDQCLSDHEAERDRLVLVYKEMQPVLAKIEHREQIRHELANFEIYQQDPSRLTDRQQGAHKNRMYEEKMRSLQTRGLPNLNMRLAEMIKSWESEHQMPFLVHGQRFADVMKQQEQEEREKEAERKRIAQEQREQIKQERMSVYREVSGTGVRAVGVSSSTVPGSALKSASKKKSAGDEHAVTGGASAAAVMTAMVASTPSATPMRPASAKKTLFGSPDSARSLRTLGVTSVAASAAAGASAGASASAAGTTSAATVVTSNVTAAAKTSQVSFTASTAGSGAATPSADNMKMIGRTTPLPATHQQLRAHNKENTHLTL